MQPKRYATAAAFRRALEDRLQDIAGRKTLTRSVRRQADRLLARLFHPAQPRPLPWVLKGGYAMELRIKAARTTKDIDLTMRSVLSSSEKKDDKKNLVVLEKLQESAAFSSDDFFVYTIGEAIADLDAAPYGGARFPVEARLDGLRIRWIPPRCRDRRCCDGAARSHSRARLAGVCRYCDSVVVHDPSRATVCRKSTPILPRKGPANTRVRDLVDMVLLIQSGTLTNDKVAEAIQAGIFERRKTHSLPDTLPVPPAEWQNPYRALARECDLSGQLEDAFAVLQMFVESILGR